MTITANTEQILIAIRKHCLECSGGSVKMVERCEIKRCNLYPYRCIKAMGGTKQEKVEKGQISFFEALEKGGVI